MKTTGRNEPCPCGSGRRYKHCCGQLNPNPANQADPEALYHLGVRALQRGDYQAALDLMGTSLAVQPRSVDARINLGIALASVGRAAEAVASFHQALALAPNSAEAHANLGNALLNEGKFDQAAESLRKAVALKPDHAIAHNNLGNAFAGRGKHDQAIECYRKALTLRPDYAEAHFNLGLAVRDLGMLDEAAASLRAAVGYRPRFPQAHNALGTVLHEIGRLEEAAQSFHSALALIPEFAEAHFNLHSVLLDLEGAASAIGCLQRAVQCKPHETAFRFFLGALLEYAGDPAGAAAHFAALSPGSRLDQARLDSWRYIQSRTHDRPVLVGSPVRMFRIGLESASHPGMVLEFGVRHGASIRQIAALAGQPVHGFDSFEGLPEDWHGEPAAVYSTQGALPPVPQNVSLHPGWFEDSLPAFLASHAGPVRFVNVDCDLYSSAKTIFEHLAARIVPGTVIVFDEYLGYEQWREDEFKAFQEALRAHSWRYEYLAFGLSTKQALVRLLQ
jgi:tetratricopeptide (TPR) repeat protein